MAPVISDLRLIMNWDSESSDLDLYSYQIDTNKRSASCTTYSVDKDSCDGVRLDLDNNHGGNVGPETISYYRIADTDNHVYMIYVDDKSNRPDQFKTSAARLSITDGVQTVRVNMAVSYTHLTLPTICSV